MRIRHGGLKKSFQHLELKLPAPTKNLGRCPNPTFYMFYGRYISFLLICLCNTLVHGYLKRYACREEYVVRCFQEHACWREYTRQKNKLLDLTLPILKHPWSSPHPISRKARKSRKPLCPRKKIEKIKKAMRENRENRENYEN